MRRATSRGKLFHSSKSQCNALHSVTARYMLSEFTDTIRARNPVKTEFCNAITREDEA